MKRLMLMTGFMIGLATLVMAQDKPAVEKPVRIDRYAGSGKGAMEGDFPILQMRKELQISREQMQKMQGIFSGSTNEMNALYSKMQETAKAQAEMMSQDMPNEEVVLKGADEIAKIRAEIGRIRIKQVLAACKILTPEQRVKMREKMNEKIEKNRTEGSRTKRLDRGPAGGSEIKKK